MLAKSKLNSIETLMFQALIDLEISHEEFKTIVNEKEKYDQMKERIRNKKDGDEFSEIFFYICSIKWLLLLLRNMQMQVFIQ